MNREVNATYMGYNFSIHDRTIIDNVDIGEKSMYYNTFHMDYFLAVTINKYQL
jgi:hypothetical protein